MWLRLRPKHTHRNTTQTNKSLSRAWNRRHSGAPSVEGLDVGGAARSVAPPGPCAEASRLPSSADVRPRTRALRR
eukprot:15473534-Alexandrium_andersonii.AAC.1